MSETPVRVDAYSGSRGEQEPRRFERETRTEIVSEILGRWRDPGGEHFEVRCESGRVAVLVCREPELDWFEVDSP